MKKRHVKPRKIIAHLLTGKTKYITIGVAVLLLGGSALAYHVTQLQSRQVQQEQASDTGSIPVSTANPDTLILVNPSNNGASTGNQSGQSPGQSSQPSSSSSASVQSRSSSSSSKKSCTNVTIPYGTTYQQTSTLQQGQTRQWLPGSNGTKQVCINPDGTSTEMVISQPVNAVVQEGTAPPTPTYSYDEAWSAAQSACAGIYYDSSQHGDCVTSEMHKRGWYYQGGQWVAS